MDTYKERAPKENSKNSLSRAVAREGEPVGDEGTSDPTDETLRAYFARGKHGPRKLASELRAYRELREQFSEAEVAICLNYITRTGLPSTGEPCHSPMAFLATAIASVLPVAEGERAKSIEKQSRAEAERLESRQREVEAESKKARFEQQEQAFASTFRGDLAQKQAIERYSGSLGSFFTDPALLRRAAIHAWAASIGPSERSLGEK